MKDIGYYAGWLDEETQADIENSDSEDLLETIADIAMDIRRDVLGAPPHGVHQIYDGQSKPNKLSLIRALCDRIELKLMEAAK
jgi:hypothetical protein